MSSSKVAIVTVALVVAGATVVGSVALGPRPPSNSNPTQTVSSPTFGNEFNLPSMLGMLRFVPAPTITSQPGFQPNTPTPQPTATTTPTTAPQNPTTPPNQPTPTNTNVHNVHNPPFPTTPGNPPTGNPPTGPPNPTTGPVNGACSWMNNGLPNVTEYYPNGGTAMPATTKEVCAFNGTSYYSLPFRNANCRATQAGIDRAYARMQTYYPSYFARTRLKEDWQTVQQYAIRYNFNPLFLISLWIEESAASGATQATKLGCDWRRNRDNSYTQMPASSTICEQMECHFGLQSAYPGNYALWACNYRYGANFWQNNQCQDAIGFTKGIEFWYNYIANGSLPAGCNVQYFNGADSRCPSK